MTDHEHEPMPPDGAGETQRGRLADPLSRRMVSCAIWLGGYGAVWGFGVWKPPPQVAWVNFAILGAIVLATLPPARVRPFTAAGALLGLAAVMFIVMNETLLAVVLGVTGLLALSDGAFGFRGRG